MSPSFSSLFSFFFTSIINTFYHPSKRFSIFIWKHLKLLLMHLSVFLSHVFSYLSLYFYSCSSPLLFIHSSFTSCSVSYPLPFIFSLQLLFIEKRALYLESFVSCGHDFVLNICSFCLFFLHSRPTNPRFLAFSCHFIKLLTTQSKSFSVLFSCIALSWVFFLSLKEA